MMRWLKVFRGHPDLNQGPLDLQSNALPLSYIPIAPIIGNVAMCILVYKCSKLIGHTRTDLPDSIHRAWHKEHFVTRDDDRLV